MIATDSTLIEALEALLVDLEDRARDDDSLDRDVDEASDAYHEACDRIGQCLHYGCRTTTVDHARCPAHRPYDAEHYETLHDSIPTDVDYVDPATLA